MEKKTKRCPLFIPCTHPHAVHSYTLPSVVLQPVLMSTGHTPMYTSAVSTLVRAQRSAPLRHPDGYRYHHQSSSSVWFHVLIPRLCRIGVTQSLAVCSQTDSCLFNSILSVLPEYEVICFLMILVCSYSLSFKSPLSERFALLALSNCFWTFYTTGIERFSNVVLPLHYNVEFLCYIHVSIPMFVYWASVWKHTLWILFQYKCIVGIFPWNPFLKLLFIYTQNISWNRIQPVSVKQSTHDAVRNLILICVTASVVCWRCHIARRFDGHTDEMFLQGRLKTCRCQC